MADIILRLQEILNRKGSSKSSHYQEISKGLWTKPVALGPRMRGWPESEADVLIAARIAGKTEVEIRALVIELHQVRKTTFEKFERENMRTSTSGAAA